jgi:hypothetical protein
VVATGLAASARKLLVLANIPFETGGVLKSPQGSGNKPVLIGDREYDNSRHKVFDTYFIPTLSVGYSW